jgi:ribosomal protein S18 acetylase RimI-like enzyme
VPSGPAAVRDTAPLPWLVVRQQTLRFGESWARIAPWRGGGGAAHLVVGPDAGVSSSVVLSCVERARASGYQSVLTSAVSPAESDAFVAAGFSVQERLHLLAVDLDAEPPLPKKPLERATRRDRTGVLELDAASFDAFWQLGPVGLRDALSATPTSRFRVGHQVLAPEPTYEAGAPRDNERDKRLAAYGITGLAGSHGYLQRVAVHPDARRDGWGRTLVSDALGWLWRNGAHRAYVNTQLENHRALALYESFGFAILPAGLCVLGRQL